MAAKKSTKKSAEKTTKKAANKTAKKAAKKSAKKTAKKAAGEKKPAASQSGSKPPPAKKKAAAPEVTSGFSSMAVNMGHVFALRPRVGASFRPDDFRVARQKLESESFETAAEAARAVVEEAMDVSRSDANPSRNKHQKRF